MDLMTKALEAEFRKIGTQENVRDPIVVCKFFYPAGAGTWYAISYDPEKREFFGFVDLLEAEWGYFSLDELEEVKGPLGLGIERDLHWEPVPISQVMPKACFGRHETE